MAAGRLFFPRTPGPTAARQRAAHSGGVRLLFGQPFCRRNEIKRNVHMTLIVRRAAMASRMRCHGDSPKANLPKWFVTKVVYNEMRDGLVDFPENGPFRSSDKFSQLDLQLHILFKTKKQKTTVVK